MTKEKGYQLNLINEKQIVIKNIPNDETDYDEWKLKHSEKTNTGNVILNEPSEKYYNKEDNLIEIARKIKNYPLENSTPMQTMLFVQQLKQLIKNGVIL